MKNELPNWMRRLVGKTDIFEAEENPNVEDDNPDDAEVPEGFKEILKEEPEPPADSKPGV